MVVDIKNLKNTLTNKQYISFNNTRYRLENGDIVSSLNYIKGLVAEGYQLQSGNKNSFVIRTEPNAKTSIILNAVEAKVFNAFQNGAQGLIKPNGLNTYKVY